MLQCQNYKKLYNKAIRQYKRYGNAYDKSNIIQQMFVKLCLFNVRFVKIHILHDLHSLCKFSFPNLCFTDINHMESKNVAASKFYRI